MHANKKSHEYEERRGKLPLDDDVPEEINEEITENILNEQSNDNKSSSNNILTVSQSLGNNGTIDSHMLDHYRIQKTLKYNNEYVLYSYII